MKRFALYAYGASAEESKNYFRLLCKYTNEVLQLDLTEVIFFIDTGNITTAKDSLMNRLEDFKTIVTPAYWHFNTYFELYNDYYEKRFLQNGINVICLNEEKEYKMFIDT